MPGSEVDTEAAEFDRAPVAYRTIFQHAPDGIVIVDEEGQILEANPAAEEMFGWEAEQLRGEKVEVLVPEQLRAGHHDHREEFFEDPHARPMGIGMELEGRRQDGSSFPVEISLSPMEADGRRLVISTIRDVTERKRLREFGSGALQAAEEERRRIARELHDDTAQRLAGLLIRLRLARRAEDPERRAELLDRTREEILASAEAIRRIARGLRPPALEDAGLGAAIRWHVRQQADPAELTAEVDLEPVEERLDDDAKLAIYRIVQEALSNTIRHASATTVQVRLRHRDGVVVAEVADDGAGFRLEGSVERFDDGLGLLGMKERAAVVGGTLEIDTEPGKGTRVRASIPARAEEGRDG